MTQTTFEQGFDSVAELVKRFSRNAATFRSAEYNETRVRIEFINPFFEALGWDVRNREGIAPQYQEVLHEYSAEVEGTRKAPDYAFRTGSQAPKFYVEAKKPGVNVKTNADAAYQLRRYAWSARLPLSLLTDFEELAVYDCRSRPSNADKASVGRVQFYTYESYPDHFRDIWDVFSRQAVREGSFDRFVKSEKGKGTSLIDAEFLKEIEGWRDVLARNMALRNAWLAPDDLNDAVQRTIDRIIFMRMAEDRGIEEYGRLLRLAQTPTPSPSPAKSAGEGSGIYADLIDLCRRADARYNSGLFDLSADTLTPRLSVDDKALQSIIGNLYFPSSPYEFSVLPIRILGNIYEQFLGQVIRLTAGHQAKVEEKPEVKKAGGVYYTPEYIVDYIVRRTVGQLVEGKSPKQLASFRALDMACGSGSFLLGAYQCLLDYYLRWYSEHQPEKHTQAVYQTPSSNLPLPGVQAGQGGGWRLTIAEKKRILTTHIFGVDIDRQAVEVTKLSLLLKVLEGESDETLGQQLALFQERALPNLDNNVKCGNSLIGPDYFTGQLLTDADELRRVNAFDWATQFPDAMKAGGFDCVIGNPPYIDSEWMTRTNPSWRAYCNEHYASARGNWDIFCVFVEKALHLCRESGLSSMIVPNKMLSADYANALRRLIVEGHSVVALRDYSQVPVFPVAVYPIIYVARAKRSKSVKTVQVEKMQVTGTTSEVAESRMIEWKDLVALDGKSWSNILSGDSGGMIDKIRLKTQSLGEVAIVSGAATVAEAYEYKELIVEYVPRMKHYFALVNTGTIDRYAILWGERPTRYIKSTFEKPVIPQSQWGKLSEKRQREAQSPKIIVGGMTKCLECAYDPGGRLAGKSTSVILFDSLDLRYLLGVLNSRLMTYYYKKTFAGLSLQGGFFRIGPPQLKELPIHVPQPDDQTSHDRMVTLVEQMLELHKRLHAAASASDRELYQRQIDATDREIDRLVYELYGLTEEEVKIVEGS